MPGDVPGLGPVSGIKCLCGIVIHFTLRNAPQEAILNCQQSFFNKKLKLMSSGKAGVFGDWLLFNAEKG